MLLHSSVPEDCSALIEHDASLESHRPFLESRLVYFKRRLSELEQIDGGFLDFAASYRRFGFRRRGFPSGITYREWAPQAKQLSLMGDFNGWNRQSHPCIRNVETGIWEAFLPDHKDGQSQILHGDAVKCCIVTADGKELDRVPAWSTFARQLNGNVHFDSIFWNHPTPYFFKHDRPPRPSSLRIYEAHVGMSSETEGISTFSEFTERILPRIARLGYNALMLMGIAEHPYYASFGYLVTSYFAVSSRFGDPNSFAALVDEAHRLGIVVLLDVVHSHAASNILDGLNEYDGGDNQYFHPGPRGWHKEWGSKLFDYGKVEVLRFLLSNLRFWMDEYCVDGFRFDGVTSMIFKDHGLGRRFRGTYEEYFSEDGLDVDAIAYLTLANELVHSVYPDAITIAEDVSGYPTLCRPVSQGGIGFDYRLGMNVPDMWFKLLRDVRDEDWSMERIVKSCLNRRKDEPCVAYCESHDQALVGDKTIAHWLFGSEIYDNMSIFSPRTPVVDRGLALHKMIRCLTYTLAGEAYLNFMGNEFGHPEWVDFPRDGNRGSYKYARRQWILAETDHLRYKFLENFDVALHSLEAKYSWLHCSRLSITYCNDETKILVFERGPVVWIFNFHPCKSFSDFQIGVSWPGEYQTIICSDDENFGGHNRVDKSVKVTPSALPWHNKPHSVRVYSPCRTVIALALPSKPLTPNP